MYMYIYVVKKITNSWHVGVNKSLFDLCGGPEKGRLVKGEGSRLKPSSRTSWGGGRPGCWAGHLPGRW